MTGNPEEVVVLAFLGVVFAWNLVLTILFWRLLHHYRLLGGRVKKGSLETVLTELIKSEELFKKNIDELRKGLLKLERKGRFNLKKWGLVRFNPFSEVGGNQSFSLALLDENQSGLVVTSLHTREGTRVYVKLIEKGKAKDGELSKEEELAVKKAEKRRER